jgi:hypothetical protein
MATRLFAVGGQDGCSPARVPTVRNDPLRRSRPSGLSWLKRSHQSRPFFTVRSSPPVQTASPSTKPLLSLQFRQLSSDRDTEQDEVVITENVGQVGQQTLYKRGNVVCTSETAELFSNDNGLKLDVEKLGEIFHSGTAGDEF